jgi:hypothetical protein
MFIPPFPAILIDVSILNMILLFLSFHPLSRWFEALEKAPYS